MGYGTEDSPYLCLTWSISFGGNGYMRPMLYMDMGRGARSKIKKWPVP